MFDAGIAVAQVGWSSWHSNLMSRTSSHIIYRLPQSYSYLLSYWYHIHSSHTHLSWCTSFTSLTVPPTHTWRRKSCRSSTQPWYSTILICVQTFFSCVGEYEMQANKLQIDEETCYEALPVPKYKQCLCLSSRLSPWHIQDYHHLGLFVSCFRGYVGYNLHCEIKWNVGCSDGRLSRSLRRIGVSERSCYSWCYWLYHHSYQYHSHCLFAPHLLAQSVPFPLLPLLTTIAITPEVCSNL